MAGAERFELSTVGFGDRCSTARTTPLLVNAVHDNEEKNFCKGVILLCSFSHNLLKNLSLRPAIF